MTQLHVIVVGLGAVGSAAAWRLAAAGHRVSAFDRWRPPHPHGSTHGDTRVTRISAWEGPQYVPLVQRANVLWRELAADTNTTLGAATGGIFVGHAGDRIIAGSRTSAESARIPYEMLAPAEIERRVPGFVAPAAMVGFADPGAGVLYPERIVEAMHAAARSDGAELRYNEPMLSWRADGAGVRVTTVRGDVVADRLVLAMGAWMPEVAATLGVTLRVERQTILWFDAASAPPSDATRPVLIVNDESEYSTVIFPVKDGLVKAAGHGHGGDVTPETVDRAIHASDIEPAAAALERAFPARYGAHRRGATCLYTCTPDGDFILDRHPAHPQVVLASPCNGFGFKFASALGEGVAALATDTTGPVALDPWALRA